MWTLTAEVFGIVGNADSTSAKQPRFQAGMRWRPIDRFSIDVIYGRNLTGEQSNWITLATVFRFKAGGAGDK